MKTNLIILVLILLPSCNVVEKIDSNSNNNARNAALIWKFHPTKEAEENLKAANEDAKIKSQIIFPGTNATKKIDANSKNIEESAELIHQFHADKETIENLRIAKEEAEKKAEIVNKEAVAEALKKGAESAASIYGVPTIVTDTAIAVLLGLFGFDKFLNRKKKPVV